MPSGSGSTGGSGGHGGSRGNGPLGSRKVTNMSSLTKDEISRRLDFTRVNIKANRYNIHQPPHQFQFFKSTFVVGSLKRHKMNIIKIWISIMIPIIVFFGFMIASRNDFIHSIEMDQAYYFNMIEEASPDQYMMADVTSYFEGDSGKYYVTYNIFKNGDKLWRNDGYTYSIYTKAEAMAVYVAGEIEIVVDELPLTANTDSINSDYMSYDITDDGTYIIAKFTRNIYLIIEGIAVIAIIGLSVYYARMLFSHHVSQYEKEQMHKRNTDPYAAEKTQYCLYCGSIISKDDERCPYCNAAKSYADYV